MMMDMVALMAVALTAVLAVPPQASHRAPARCSRHEPDAVAPSAWRATRHVLAPRGATAVRLCRYSGLNGHPRLRLVRGVKRTRPRLVRRIVRRLDALQSPHGAYSCPADDGSEIVVHLAYRGGRRLTVDVGLTGCRIASNGRRSGMAVLRPGGRLLHLLRRLTE
jgi:hypothetical protein